jgi:hypothetical protein
MLRLLGDASGRHTLMIGTHNTHLCHCHDAAPIDGSDVIFDRLPVVSVDVVHLTRRDHRIGRERRLCRPFGCADLALDHL